MTILNKNHILFLGYDETQTGLIHVLQERGNRVTQTVDRPEDLSSFDVVVSFGYRKLVTKTVLETARRPIINLHIGYLPYNRGAHPNVWAFLDNTPAGVTIHEMDEGVDTGPIIYQRYVNFHATEHTFAATYDRLIRAVETLFLEHIDALLTGHYSTKPQRGKGTYHATQDLPQAITQWDLDIEDTLNALTDRKITQYERDMQLVKEIENVRKSNNVNWMDLLRIGLKHAPLETKKILRKINADDNKISELFERLGE